MRRRVAGCTGFYEIPIETPIQPKMDVSAFQRVLVAGFISGGTEDVDANLETVRLLRSQLRTKSPLRVIEAEVLPLVEMAADRKQSRARRRQHDHDDVDRRRADRRRRAAEMRASTAGRAKPDAADPAASRTSRNEKDLAKYDKIFADVAYWKKLGEEYQKPLIVTGTVLFTPHQANGFVMQNREVYDSFGRRSVDPGAHLPGAQGLHPAAAVRLHRRPHRRGPLLGDTSTRRSSTTRSRTCRRCPPTSS